MMGEIGMRGNPCGVTLRQWGILVSLLQKELKDPRWRIIKRHKDSIRLWYDLGWFDAEIIWNRHYARQVAMYFWDKTGDAPRCTDSAQLRVNPIPREVDLLREIKAYVDRTRPD